MLHDTVVEDTDRDRGGFADVIRASNSEWADIEDEGHAALFLSHSYFNSQNSNQNTFIHCREVYRLIQPLLQSTTKRSREVRPRATIWCVESRKSSETMAEASVDSQMLFLILWDWVEKRVVLSALLQLFMGKQLSSRKIATMPQRPVTFDECFCGSSEKQRVSHPAESSILFQKLDVLLSWYSFVDLDDVSLAMLSLRQRAFSTDEKSDIVRPESPSLIERCLREDNGIIQRVMHILFCNVRNLHLSGCLSTDDFFSYAGEDDCFLCLLMAVTSLRSGIGPNLGLYSSFIVKRSHPRDNPVGIC